MFTNACYLQDRHRVRDFAGPRHRARRLRNVAVAPEVKLLLMANTVHICQIKSSNQSMKPTAHPLILDDI